MSNIDTNTGLSWKELPANIRRALDGPLNGLYQHARAADAFNALTEDKQQALRMLTKCFLTLELWPHVRSVGNVWGEGGVGMNFTAWPSFLETLRWHRKFSRRLAQRPGQDGGFRETHVKHGGLHILFKGRGESRLWDAHFDMYNPLFSPSNTVLHVWNEVINSKTPDWQMVEKWLQNRA